MKKLLFAVGPLVALTACEGQNTGKWSDDCWTYHSVNNRELSECKKRVEANHLYQVEPGTVKIDHNDEERPGFNELGKERDGSSQ